MRINSVPDVKCFYKIKMCYVYNQWYDISCVTLCLFKIFFLFWSVTLSSVLSLVHVLFPLYSIRLFIACFFVQLLKL